MSTIQSHPLKLIGNRFKVKTSILTRGAADKTFLIVLDDLLLKQFSVVYFNNQLEIQKYLMTKFKKNE